MQSELQHMYAPLPEIRALVSITISPPEARTTRINEPLSALIRHATHDRKGTRVALNNISCSRTY